MGSGYTLRFTPVLLNQIFFYHLQSYCFSNWIGINIAMYQNEKMSCLHHCLINNIIIILNVLSNRIRPQACLHLLPFEFCHLAENQPEYHNQ